MIHFDAHADTGTEQFGSLFGHGLPMRRLIESGATRGDRFLQIGLRGYWPEPPTLAWMAEQRMRSYEMTEIVRRGLADCLAEAFAIAVDECDGVFLSVDIDVVDPGTAPGTGTPEPGGLTARQLLDAVRRIAIELPLVGMDVVEVSPPYDSADVTAFLANRVVLEALSAIARSGAPGGTDPADIPSLPLLERTRRIRGRDPRPPPRHAPLSPLRQEENSDQRSGDRARRPRCRQQRRGVRAGRSPYGGRCATSRRSGTSSGPTTTPVFFVGATPFNLLGLDRWVRNFDYITYYDAWDGAHPRVFTPKDKPYIEFESGEEINNYLLQHDEVQAYHAARRRPAQGRDGVLRRRDRADLRRTRLRPDPAVGRRCGSTWIRRSSPPGSATRPVPRACPTS